MLEEVTLREIEAIFEITDAMGLSRELLVIPRPHGTGTRAMMSCTTASVVRPWLAA